MLKQSCTKAPESDFIDWQSGSGNMERWCSFYAQVEDTPCHSSERVKACDNCIHYIVIETGGSAK